VADLRPNARSSLTGIAARLAAASTVVGAGLVVASVVATRRLWFGGYVSEAGVAAEPQASTYRWGILGLALGLLLLAVALVRVLPLTAVLLAGSGLFAALSGSVSCSTGCPLPPYESATAADLVHGGASILAVGAATLAIAALAVTSEDTPVRRLSRLTFWIVGPLVVAVGLAMLVLGRGQLTGLLERAILLTATAWTLVAALRVGAGTATMGLRR